MNHSNGKPVERPPAAWIELVFTRLECALVAYVRSRLSGDLDLARDVVQEAFAKLCQQPWPEIESYHAAWLYRTCRNRAIDYSRREGRMSRTQSQTNVATLYDQSQPPPEARLAAEEQVDFLRTQLDRLPDRQQELLRLRLHDGLSYKQIAHVTGLTVSNVGYHLHQAIASLRTAMASD